MYGTHLVNQIKADPLLINTPNTLHVIIVLSNYARYHSRLRLFRECYERLLKTPNVEVYVVEAAFGERAHEVAVYGDPKHLQLRTCSEIWVKENLINLGVRYLLPRDWRYMSWIDADVEFREEFWAMEAMQQAQSFAVLQPWQTCSDLGPWGNSTQQFSSFGWCWQAGVKIQTHPSQPYRYAHSGFAWVCRRDWYEAANGLYDKAILGSGDHHMAWACVGSAVSSSVDGRMTAGFKRSVQDWEDKVVPVTHGQVGYSSGRIEHNFHGPKARRAYRGRWQILIEYKYDPFKDLVYDHQGMIQIVGKPGLENAIRHYNRSRQEDDICE